jgi:hypothetical protein
MFGVDAMPVLRDIQRGRLEEAAGVTQNALVDFGAVEGIDGHSIFVRVADGQLAASGLENEHVDAPAIICGRLGGDALLQCAQNPANLERFIET